MNLEQDLQDNFADDLQDKSKAVELYSSLCNLKWVKNGQENTMSWRYAGEVVANIRNSANEDINECYLDFYCSGNEGVAADWVEEKLKNLGYKKEEY